jgi:hypothetical protein
MRAEYDFSKGRRGAVLPVPRGKTRITIRLDDDLLTWFRARVDAAGGGSYQTLINLALRDYVTRREERLEETLRRVLREELPRSGNPPSAMRKPRARRPNTAPVRTAGAGRVRDTARARAGRSTGTRSSS